MEEMLELAVVIIAAAIGIASKANKKKKKVQKPVKPATSAWDEMEEFCKLIAGKDDIFYGTNTEVLL